MVVLDETALNRSNEVKTPKRSILVLKIPTVNSEFCRSPVKTNRIISPELGFSNSPIIVLRNPQVRFFFLFLANLIFGEDSVRRTLSLKSFIIHSI